MLRRDFYFDLPEDLIAQYPPERRGASRLLCLDGPDGELRDRMFVDLPCLLRPGDLLVFNDTRVIPARLYGLKASGGKVEVLVERVLDERRVLAHVRASRAPKAGSRLLLDQGLEATVLGRQGELFELSFESGQTVIELLEKHGHVPLPPYIDRTDTACDSERYQTVYARQPGAVAAPTAGLHFSEQMLLELKAAGVEQAFITLHVGAGTFQPVRAERVDDHRMHGELVEVDDQVCAQIQAAKKRGGRIVAVGTTVVRGLESASRVGTIAPLRGETHIFIRPGYRFHCVDALVTNFHLPESTLLMLVAAFAGHRQVMAAYRHAIDRAYRFFSYGDAMFMTRGV